MYISILVYTYIYVFTYMGSNRFRTSSRTHIDTWTRFIMLHYQRRIPSIINRTAWSLITSTPLVFSLGMIP